MILLPPTEQATVSHDPEMRRILCVQTAMGLVMRGLLLVWEVADYAKYLENFLSTGMVPLEKEVPSPSDKKPKRTTH